MNPLVRSRSGPDLSSPRGGGLRIGSHYGADTFGDLSEKFARFIGTARFLMYQTVFIIVWISWNSLAPKAWQFDAYSRGLVLLTLVLSLQAAYAAPLILLAQNRQADRDRVQVELDRDTAFRTQAETEFLARELASIRFALSDVATYDEIENAIERAITRALAANAAATAATTTTTPSDRQSG